MKDNIDNQVKIIVPKEFFCHLIDGTEVKVPKPNWGKELKIIDIITETQSNIPKEYLEEGKISSPSELVTILLKTFPRQATKIIAILLDKDEKYVEENFNSEGVMELLVPFFKIYTGLMNEALTKIAKLQTSVK